MIDIIDSHVHFFALDTGDYHWLKPHNPPHWPDKTELARPVSEADLRLGDTLSLAGFVHIEAGFDNAQPWREIDWLAQHCHRPFAAVAGWDLTDVQGEHTLAKLLQRTKVTGVRHILDEDAVSILTHPLAAQHFGLLQDANLRFDVQLPLSDSKGVNALVKIIRQFPALPFIINHAGFPFSDTLSPNHWQNNLAELAQYSNVAIKLSGWEMQERQWKTKVIRPVMHHIFNVFGRQRVMLGSNFPLCLWHASYENFWQTMVSIVAIDDVEAVACNNARHWYDIPG
ncbi:amidohydrolase family protein [Alteromonas sp. C1M14]|uniref:amidohydrolase family protein n=1 Tax=Alteromonas sp. C1M14 TaxID=2841567 RepID=UPI001C093DD2|nr:amidohydrolase family protein [Alteromonas sp. C1M14]